MQLFGKKKKKRKKKKSRGEDNDKGGESKRERDEREAEGGERQEGAPRGASKSTDGEREQEKTFASLGLAAWIQRSCRSLGMRAPTEVQSSCIPRTLAGDDVCGCASTGSGKTAAFALPILQKLSEDPYGVYALVLTPARELAFQIADQFKALGTAGRGLSSLRVAVVIGGLDHTQQSVELSKRSVFLEGSER